MRRAPNFNFLLSISILLAGAMISGSVLWGSLKLVEAEHQLVAWGSSQLEADRQSRTAQTQAQAQNTTPPEPVVDATQINTVGEPFIGDPKAPVMVFWFDYQCPYCKEVEETVMPQVIADYVKTGKLRVVFKDFEFLGQDSRTAALAARAVWEVAPDKFYDWHKAMFDKQDGENGGWGSKDDILALTKTIGGLDATKVEELMAGHAAQYQKAIDADLAEGNANGINGTPGSVVGKKLLAGAEPYPAFQAAIEAALKPAS
jgi:protein-disulfide isomerase